MSTYENTSAASRALSLPPSGAQPILHSVELAVFPPWLAFPLFQGSCIHPSSLGSSDAFQLLVSMYSQVPGFVSNTVNKYSPTTEQWVGLRAPGFPPPPPPRGGGGGGVVDLFYWDGLVTYTSVPRVCAKCRWRSEGGIRSPNIGVLHSYEGL